MRFFNRFNGLSLALVLGGASGITLGCVIGTGSSEPTACGDTFSNSFLDGDTCYCESGYDWCSNDPEDFECCSTEFDPCEGGNNNHLEDGLCVCNAGYDWCSEDPSDLSCCEVGSTATDTTATDTSGDGDGDGDGDTGDTGDGDGDGDGDTGDTGGSSCTEEPIPPPESCTPEEQDSAWCTQSTDECLGSSETYFCDNGVWVLDAEAANAFCADDGFDFGYGCVDDGEGVNFVCGVGPGDACEEGSAPSCQDEDVILECFFGKTTATSCTQFCQDVGIDGVMFEFGACDDTIDPVDCVCSDE